MRTWLLVWLVALLLVGCVGRQKVENVTLRWQSFETIQAAFPKTSRPLFLYIAEEGCGHCRYMDSAVFSRPEVAQYVNEHFTPVKVDIYLDMPITVNDSIMSEIQFRRLLSIEGTPAYYFFERSGKIIGVLDSEMDLLRFKRMLVFIQDGHFFRTPWEQFIEMSEADLDTIEGYF